MFHRGGQVAHQNQKPVTDFQELYCAVVAHRLVANCES